MWRASEMDIFCLDVCKMHLFECKNLWFGYTIPRFRYTIPRFKCKIHHFHARAASRWRLRLTRRQGDQSNVSDRQTNVGDRHTNVSDRHIATDLGMT